MNYNKGGGEPHTLIVAQEFTHCCDQIVTVFLADNGPFKVIKLTILPLEEFTDILPYQVETRHQTER
jgi:hypothetical protein